MLQASCRALSTNYNAGPLQTCGSECDLSAARPACSSAAGQRVGVLLLTEARACAGRSWLR